MEKRTQTTKGAEILDAAERHMRKGGFDAVSFRDLAAEVGIKSASVHYHFPQKADLGAAVVERYAARIMAFLGAPDDPAETVHLRITRLCETYRQALFDDGLACLCCVLGAAFPDLPKPVAATIRTFFDQLLLWTERALAGGDGGTRRAKATHIVASLQGSMILAMTTGDEKRFAETVKEITGGL